MLFLDCEFDGFGGSLISMAMISSSGNEFYEVVEYPIHPALGMPNDWVKENVIPKLGKEPISGTEFREKLHGFLLQHPGQIIVADSPADFKYLLGQLEWMDKDKYQYLNLEVKMQFTPSGKYTPENPHNALSDAKALREWYKKNILNLSDTTPRPHGAEHTQKDC